MSYVGTAIQKVELTNAGTAGTPAGEVLSVQGFGYSSSVDITRPNNTSSYTVGNVVGDTGGSAILEFQNIGPAGGNIFLTSAWLRIDLPSIPVSMTSFRLHLYSAAPDALADRGAWDLLSSGDRSKYRSYVDLGAPVDVGSSLYCQVDGINKQIPLGAGSTSLFGLLVTTGGYAGAVSTVYAVRLRAVSV